MKIFPLKAISAYDRFKNIYKIMTQTSIKPQNAELDIITFNKNETKKGRNICDMLSE
jgi:hypothetical protein